MPNLKNRGPLLFNKTLMVGENTTKKSVKEALDEKYKEKI